MKKAVSKLGKVGKLLKAGSKLCTPPAVSSGRLPEPTSRCISLRSRPRSRKSMACPLLDDVGLQLDGLAKSLPVR